MTDPANSPAIFHTDLASLAPASPDSIISRTLVTDDKARTILFTFAPGQELSEHTASVAATLYIVRGNADVILGEQDAKAGPGFWAHLPPNMPHSILAHDETVMLLIMYKGK